jgi:RNA polymerase sigma factor (sigma-70 family)
MTTETDIWADVVQRAQERDSATLIHLLEEFENVIQSACRRFVLPASEQGDLLQEAYMGFLKAVFDFDPTRGVYFAAYAKAKTVAAAWQFVRARNRQQSREQTESATSSEDGTTPMLERVADPHTEEPFCDMEWRSLLASLSEREALAVEKLVIDGLSMRELAQMEGVSSETVKTWKKRAFAKIRDEIKKTQS